MTGCMPMVLTTTPPQPASNARMMFESDSVGGADASRNGFSNWMPVNLVESVVFMCPPVKRESYDAQGSAGRGQGLDFDRVHERHHLAQFGPDLLDLVRLFRGAARLEPGPAGLVLRDPAAGVAARTNVVEHPAHFDTRLLRHQAVPAGVVAVF